MEDDVSRRELECFFVLFIIQTYKQCVGGCGWNIHRTDTWSPKKEQLHFIHRFRQNNKEGKQVIKKGDNYQNAIDLWQWSKCPKDPNAVKYATTHKTTQGAFKKGTFANQSAFRRREVARVGGGGWEQGHAEGGQGGVNGKLRLKSQQWLAAIRGRGSKGRWDWSRPRTGTHFLLDYPIQMALISSKWAILLLLSVYTRIQTAFK